MPRKYMNFIAPAIFLAIAALSFFLVAGIVTKVEFHASTIASLDESKKTVGELIAASTAASTAITILPGDTATPIAEKLADCSSYFLIVMCAIYLEKFMLTIAGFLSFKVLIPFGCLLLALACLIRNKAPYRNFGARLVAIGLAIFLLVPVSVRISDMIRDTYGSTITEAVSSALNAAEDLEAGTEEAAPEEPREEAALPSGTEEADQEKTGGIGGLIESFTDMVGGAAETVTEAGGNIVETLTTTAAAAVEKFETALNNMIEALAVMIVTSCIIPILVMLLFIWLIRSFIGLPIGMPAGIPGFGMPGDRV